MKELTKSEISLLDKIERKNRVIKKLRDRIKSMENELESNYLH